MTEKTIKVGDVVPWADVPDGAMVRDWENGIALRVEGRGTWVFGTMRLRFVRWKGEWQWSAARPLGPVTVLALGLCGNERPKDLQKFAEDAARLLAGGR